MTSGRRALQRALAPPVRQVEISDSLLSWGEKMRVFLRRVQRWLLSENAEPRRGRLEVMRAQDEGRLVPPQLDVRTVGEDILNARARPKASMSIRVFRKETGEWSQPITVESVEIKAQPKE